ncbi:histidine kinase [Arthrobacter sp. PAMC 25486]|nr:histidine kinase [Arthrobacter sp. PAMC 25486]
MLRRGLVYGLLTACIIAVYAAALAAAGVQLTREPLVAVVGAALVAVGLSPLRTWLQRGVDVLLYGRRSDPMSAVSQLGTLAAGAREGELLHVVLAGVQDAVKATYVRIVKPDGVTLAHVGGAPAVGGAGPAIDPDTDGGAGTADFTARLSLGSVVVGDLEVGGRTPGERYPSRDERLLRAMAPQLAAVVHALALTTQVQEQRDAVLGATGRERERLRRDLHDGLGPLLTGVGLGLQGLGDAVGDARPRELVDVLHREVTAAVAEVRRILDDLAPAALADGTLAGALPQRINAVAGHLPSQVKIGALPVLPPGLEEAVYNVASEAVANAARHAHATAVTVEVTAVARLLTLRVHDDGRGIPADAIPGIGLASMRARAATLGGTVDGASSPDGTTVTLSLPLSPPPSPALSSPLSLPLPEGDRAAVSPLEAVP